MAEQDFGAGPVPGAEEFPDIALESSADFAGVPDAFQRLWTPHRMAYIQTGPAEALHS
jgi:ATP adenylyltransferase